jgi:catechol 2,3-dioxygenase
MTAPVSLSFSHVGLFVTDLERMLAFYTGLLGFHVTDRGRLGQAGIAFLSRDAREHHQLVLVEGRPPGDGAKVVNQVSFRAASLADLKAFHRRIATEPGVVLDPVNHGTAWSVYFPDPEGNRVEVFADTGWYMAQPYREPLDLSLPEERIRAETESLCRSRPGFKPIAEWRAALAERLEAGR